MWPFTRPKKPSQDELNAQAVQRQLEAQRRAYNGSYAVSPKASLGSSNGDRQANDLLSPSNMLNPLNPLSPLSPFNPMNSAPATPSEPSTHCEPMHHHHDSSSSSSTWDSGSSSCSDSSSSSSDSGSSSSDSSSSW